MAFDPEGSVTIVLDIPTSRLFKALCSFYDEDGEKIVGFEDQDEQFWMNVYGTFVGGKKAEGKWKDAVLQVVKIVAADIVMGNDFLISKEAVLNEWTELLRYICNSSIDDVKNRCLFIACNQGLLDSVETLLDCCADPLVFNETEESNAFFQAALKGHLGVTQILIKNHPEIVHSQLQNNNVLQFLVSRYDSIADKHQLKVIIKFLISQGVDANFSQNTISSTALESAISMGLELEFVDFLASISKTSATKDQKRDVSKNMFKSALMAIITGNSAALELLVEKYGVNLHNLNHNLLHIAATYHHPSIVQFLLAKTKIDVNGLNENGENCLESVLKHLDSVCLSKIQKIVELLLDAGAKVNKNSVLKIHQHFPVLFDKVILGCNPQLKLESGDTLLHLLVQSPSATATQIQSLIGKGIKANSRNNDGNTPLHMLAMFVHVDTVRPDEQDIVEALTAAGGRLDSRNKEGKIPAELCTLEWMITLLLPDEIKQNTKEMESVRFVLNELPKYFKKALPSTSMKESDYHTRW